MLRVLINMKLRINGQYAFHYENTCFCLDERVKECHITALKVCHVLADFEFLGTRPKQIGTQTLQLTLKQREQGAPYLEWDWSAWGNILKWWCLFIVATEERKCTKNKISQRTVEIDESLFWLVHWFTLHYLHMRQDHCCSTLTQTATLLLWSTV